MNTLSLAPQSENKNIKLSDKKVSDPKSEEGKDFFENIIANMISEVDNEKNGSFLLSKLLNLSTEFEKKEKTLSNFSDGALFTDNQVGQVLIQDLLKIATMLKNGEDPVDFPTDSKTLKLSLLKPDVKEQFKDAKNIKDLLDIAKKNNIEIKNFQFFNEEAALDPKNREMVQKVKSEDIFKLIEKQLDSKSTQNITLPNIQKTIINQTEKERTILQTVLANNKIDPHNKKREGIKVEHRENIKHNTKTTNLDTTIENKEIKGVEQKANIESEKKLVEQIQTDQTSKQKKLRTNLSQNLNLQNGDETKDIQKPIKKLEPLSEKAEISTESKETNDKNIVAQETKINTTQKIKDSHHDIKRTFNTFAQEFKEKVESYKPPLMKIKMELKPAGLGEVDVTLLNRGNNLQVNINSNSNTIAIFSQNQAEFKNSLVNMGFSDLQMNFSQQQKKEQDSQNQKNGKNVFDQFEDQDEQDGFEMIIPRYV